MGALTGRTKGQATQIPRSTGDDGSNDHIATVSRVNLGSQVDSRKILT